MPFNRTRFKESIVKNLGTTINNSRLIFPIIIIIIYSVNCFQKYLKIPLPINKFCSIIIWVKSRICLSMLNTFLFLYLFCFSSLSTCRSRSYSIPSSVIFSNWETEMGWSRMKVVRVAPLQRGEKNRKGKRQTASRRQRSRRYLRPSRLLIVGCTLSLRLTPFPWSVFSRLRPTLVH